MGDYVYENGKFEILNMRNFTNREGYDNQPYFHPSKPFLYFVSMKNDSQTDIYRYEWEKGRSYQVAETKESEYSPQLIPGKGQISSVRVEADKKQRLWAFDVLNPESPDLLIEDINNVGYTLWLDDASLMMFAVNPEKGHELIHYNFKDKNFKIIDESIGRCMLKIPNEPKVLYVSKKDTVNWKLKTINYKTSEIAELTTALDNDEDYTILDTHYILTGKGNKLYAHTLDAKNKDWVLIEDMSQFIDGEIERIVLNSEFKKIALVVKQTP
jgi:hypothetical protein